MSHFKTVQLTKALVVLVLAGSAAWGQSNGDEPHARGASLHNGPRRR
jgi:hypothetical protein